MKTQCPHCKELWNIEADEEGTSMKCFNCKTQFNAAAYTGPIPEDPPLPKRSMPLRLPEPQQPDFIPKNEPGSLCQLIAILTGIFGSIYFLFMLISEHLGEALAVLISTFLTCYLWNSLGKTMNRLKQAQEQIEGLRIELRELKYENDDPSKQS